jgi:hypothetical protein
VGLLIGTLVLGSLILLYFRGQTPLPLPPLLNPTATPSSLSALQAAGITLAETEKRPAIDQQQALLLAHHLQPLAASKAEKTSAQYVLLTTTKVHPALKNMPAWMIWYQKVPLASPDAEADSAPGTLSSQDLYLFLDASTGDELLAVWV